MSEQSNQIPNVYETLRNSMLRLYQQYVDNIGDNIQSDVSTKQGEEDNEEMSKDRLMIFLTNLQQYNIFGNNDQSKVFMDNVILDETYGETRVIAKHDIPSGNVITLVPCDLGHFGRDKAAYCFYSPYLVNETFSSTEDRQNYFTDMIKNGVQVAINTERSFFASSRNKSDSAFLGHFVRDGATDFTDKRKYLTSSLEKRNCDLKLEKDFVSPFLPIVACKDIAAGEEIFISKGIRHYFKPDVNINDIKFIMARGKDCDAFCESTNGPIVQEFKSYTGDKRVACFAQDDQVLCSLFLIAKDKTTVPENTKYSYNNRARFPDCEFIYSPVFGTKSPVINDQVYTGFLQQIVTEIPIIFFCKDEENMELYTTAGFEKLHV